jgi:hypothetical protein
MMPGAMALTRIPRGPSSLANARVSAMTAAFDALYAEMLAPPPSPAIEARFTIEPPLGIRLAASREALKRARELDPDHRDDVLYFFDKGQDDTRPVLDLARRARGTDPSALLARRLQQLEHGGEAAEALIQAARARMLAATSHANFQGLPTPELTDEAVRALLLRTARRALVELLAQQPSSPSEADAHEEVLA